MKNTGTGEYSSWWVLLENLLIGAMLVFGFFGMRFVSIGEFPVLSVSWAAFILVMLGYVLRQTLCSHCAYFGKRCHCGWGKYASLIVKKKAEGTYPLPWLGGLVWGIFMLFPLMVIVAGIVLSAVELSSVLPCLIPFVVLVIINGLLHMQDCRACCMRKVCPGSAVKAS